MENSIVINDDNATPQREETRPILATRRATSFSPAMLSRSAPDALTLAQLAPFRRTSLPASPSCSSVGTQTPKDIVHFQFPESFDFNVEADIDAPDGSISILSRSPDLPKLEMEWKPVGGGGIQRRVSFTAISISEAAKVEVQGVGQQLRSIADDFERTRIGRSRSFTFLGQKKR